MLKKVQSLILTGLLLNVIAVVPADAARQGGRQTGAVEAVREKVRKQGVGEAARVEVKLSDGRKLKGYIREAGEGDFVLVDEKSGVATTIDYSQVRQVRDSDRLTAAKVGLTAAKGAAVVAGVAAAFTLFAYILLSQMD